MSNNLRTRNGMPFNFVNGLKVRGMDIESLIPGIEGIPEAGSKYQFAGNGSNKGFTLPVTPYNKDAVDVYVKQLYVHPDDYTLVGDTITLTEAPPAVVAGETYNVVIKVSLTTLNGYVNANRVSFEGENLDDILEKSKPIANYALLRAYAGGATQVRITDPGIAGFFYYDAADTTSADNGGTIIVASNGKRWKRLFEGAVNVKWFGAKGNWDGTVGADDTAAIQEAITCAINNNIWVDVPSGAYKVTSQIIIDTRSARAGNFKLAGRRATFSVPGGNIPILNTNTFTDLSGTASTGGLIRVLTPDSDSHSCSIEGLHFYKQDATYPVRYGTLINVSTQRNTHILNCVFSGGYDIGILFTPTYGSSVERCSFTGFNTGIWCRGGVNGINIVNNSIRNGRRGIRVSSHTAADTNVGVKIIGNILESLTNDAIQFQGVRSSVVSGNYFEAIDQDGSTYYADTGDYTKKVCVYLGTGQDSNTEASARNYINGNYGWSGSLLNIFVKSGFGNVLVANNGIEVIQATPDSTVMDTGGKLAITTLSEATPGSGVSVIGRIKQENSVSVSLFENSWVNTDVVYFGPARYWRDAFGNVHLEGNIKNGSLNTSAFTLPVGYRPQYEMQLPTSSANAFGQIRISPNGQVIPRIGSNTDVNLSGIVFRAYDY